MRRGRLRSLSLTIYALATAAHAAPAPKATVPRQERVYTVRYVIFTTKAKASAIDGLKRRVVAPFAEAKADLPSAANPDRLLAWVRKRAPGYTFRLLHAGSVTGSDRQRCGFYGGPNEGDPLRHCFRYQVALRERTGHTRRVQMRFWGQEWLTLPLPLRDKEQAGAATRSLSYPYHDRAPGETLLHSSTYGDASDPAGPRLLTFIAVCIVKGE
jgi:hypothetical protein